jgi:trehalose utilization protein
MLRIVLASIALALGWHAAADAADAPLRVLVWDEQQPEQKQAYGDRFLGETIAAHLATLPGISVTSVALSSPEQGFSEATLDRTDVLVLWAHKRSKEVQDSLAERVVTRVLAGRLALIALHSAHWAKPFVRLMQERAKADALARLPEAERTAATWTYVNEAPYYQGVKDDTPLTPAVEKLGDVWRLALPRCVFPAWRADGAASHVQTLLADHPIARGLPGAWDIPHSEMYGGVFHVPKPDAVVFSERWDKGESFALSGSIWRVGDGRVFYFRPGHETYPVYRQAEPLQVIANAVRWLGDRAQ